MSRLKIHDPVKKKRPLRIASEILRDLPGILRKAVEMPAGVMISITEVEVSEDLSFAKIYFSVLGEHEEFLGQQVAELLNGRKGVVRHELAQRLIMRQHPDLRFYYDETPARAARIEQLLKSVREKPGEADGEDRGL
jgi:ribosome-binding factor A